MKVLAAIVIASSLAASGCAASRALHQQSTTEAGQLHQSIHVSAYRQLSPALRNFIRSLIRTGPQDGHVTEIDVYGPGTRAALVKASSGDIVYPTGESTEPFYLIVLHGHFVCGSCSGPAYAKAPQGTIETHVWSPTAGSLDFGIQHSLPPAVSLLNQLATIQLS